MRQQGQQYNPFRLFYGAHVPEALLRYGGISPGAKLCFGRLCRYAGERGHCWPSHGQLAEELGVGKRQIRRYLTELEIAGFTGITQVGLNRPNQYVFLWHPVFDGTERSDVSTPERTGRSSPDRTHKSGLSERESLNESTARTTKPTPPPPLLAKGGRSKPATENPHAVTNSSRR